MPVVPSPAVILSPTSGAVHPVASDSRPFLVSGPGRRTAVGPGTDCHDGSMSQSEALDLSAVRDLAVSLARGAGELARRAKGEGWDPDPPIEVDVERRIVHAVAARFPRHAVLSEASGLHGPEEADAVWIVDPLVGSGNYAIDLELFGVSLAVQRGGRTVVGVVHDSVNGRTCSAVDGEGAWREGVALRVREPRPLTEATVSWLGGQVPVRDLVEGGTGTCPPSQE
ncbi:MAG: hypothetical protein EON52_04000, partial [Actinomycetales bacterium]